MICLEERIGGFCIEIFDDFEEEFVWEGEKRHYLKGDVS